MVKVILLEYKIKNADVIVRGNYTVDDFIDAVEGNRKYIDAIFVYNKIDLMCLEDIDEVARRPDSIVVSANYKLNYDVLLTEIWNKLGLVRIYTKRKGMQPDFRDPIILTQKRNGCTVEAVCELVHKEFKNEFKHALVWGRSAKFQP